jgi:hypothetical protein
LRSSAWQRSVRAQIRRADEYDAAQQRGNVATRKDGTAIRDHIPEKNKVATVTDIGLTSKQVHEARIVRAICTTTIMHMHEDD